MRAVTPAELLNFWERGMNQTMIQRAIDLLTCASPGIGAKEIAGLSIGERDARLLLLREWLFGPRLQNMAQCPSCSEQIEWETNIRDIRINSPKPNAPSEPYLFEADGFTILFRLPDSNDLHDLMVEDEKGKMAGKFLERLILDCKYQHGPFKIADLPEKIMNSLEQRIEEENPQAEILMDLTCVHCHHLWEIQFDIVSYLWSEINGWARHVLHEIGILARVYGWSEQDILNMSPARRQIYLDMVNS